MVKHLNNIEIISDDINRSWLITENMTSSTPDKLVGTTFKSVLVNENGEFVVWEDWTKIQSDWDEADPLAPSYIQNKPDALLQQIQYPTFSSLPAIWDDRVIYYMQDDWTLWIWDITTSAYIEVETWSGIVYSLADWTVVWMTIWNRWLASAWSNADKTYETSQTIDPLTWHTTEQTFTGTVNYDGATVNSEDTIYNHVNDTINNVGVTENYDNTSTTNNNGNTINNNETITNNTEVTENYVDSTINNEWTTINNYPWLNLIQCDNIVVWIMPNPTTFAVPVGTDMIKVTLTDVTEYWPDDQTNPWCLPPYELWHTTVNYTPYNLTIWGSVSCTQTFVPWCGYIWTNPVWVVSILWDAITNEIIVSWQLIDWATQLPMYSVDVCFYQFTSDVTITNNIDSTTNYLGDNVINLEYGASITNNLDGTVTNNLWDTYVENNVYETWATINNEWEVNINYNEYTENNTHTNTVINNEWNVTNNYEDYIENNTYDSTTVINHDGGTHNYSNTEITYDNTTNVNYEGNTTMENLTVNNITFPWGNVFVNGIGNWEVTDEAVSEYSLVATPMSEGSVIVWADSGTGLFPLAPASDYTYDTLLNKITFSTPLGTGERAYIWILSWNANANLGWVSYTETFTATAGQTEFDLSDTPAWEDWIWVSTRSWLYGKLGSSLDYEYDSVTNKIILPAQDDWDVIQVRYIGFVNPIPPVTEFTFDAVELNTWTHDAETNEYILVTYTGWDTTINLPDASLNNGKQLRIKKFTGEDVLTTTILPFGTQLIDGFTWATMNINRTMYTFTAINGNWYLGD